MKGRHALALGVIVLAAPIRESRADEAPSTIYTVQAGDTCVAIATRFYGDKRFVDVIHAANPGMGPPPHSLKAGTQLVLPAKPGDYGVKPDATVTRVRNQVEVTTTTAAHPAKGNDPLYRGNRVGTKASSAADVTFRDETQVKLGEETLVVILGDTDARASRVSGTEMTLVTGELRARLGELTGKPAAGPRITTDAGVVAMKGGEAKVSADETKTTRVAVYQGGSTLTAQKKTVAVNDGFGSKAPPGNPPTPPQPLPPPPVWDSPAPIFVAALSPAELAFSYAAAPDAKPAPAGWHIQLARDADFGDVIVDQKAPLGVHRIEAKNLGTGTYYARVSAVDADRFEGKWSPVVKSTVSLLTLNELPGRRGRLAPEGAQVTCTLDGAPATFPQEIDRDRAHVAGCTDGQGVTSVVEVPALPIDRARVDVEANALRARSGFLRVTITDEHGERIGRARPVVEPVAGLEVGELREHVTERDDAKGIYIAAFEWSGPPRPTPLRIRVRDGKVFETGPVDFPRESEKFAKPGAHTGVEIGAAALGSWGVGPAAGFDVEARLAIPTSRGAVLVGGSGGWSEALDAERGGAPADAWAVDMRAVGGYRHGLGTFAPYVTLGPEVLRQHVEVGGAIGRQWLVGGSAALGLDAAVGPGAFFLEARARVVTAVEDAAPSLPASAGVLLFGYRLRLHPSD